MVARRGAFTPFALAALAPFATLAACVPVAPGPESPAKPVATTPALDPLTALSPELQQLAHEVEEARGLRFRRPFEVIAVDEAGLESHFDEGKLNQTPDAFDPSALWAFGFLKAKPPPSWLVALLARHTRKSTGLLGFYVGTSRRIYVRRDHEHDPTLVAHELAHALVDDHRKLPLDVATDDAQLARRALLEGDATITAALVVARRHGQSTVATLESASSWDSSRKDFVSEADGALGESLPLFHERVEMPYHAGATFAARVVLSRGMPGLDQTWEQPPRGTFEVFHPDVYAKGLPLPKLAAPLLPERCRVAFEGEMGELRTRAFLRAVHPRATALTGASGLLADHYRLLEGCGREPALVWQTGWADEAAAERFEALASGVFACPSQGCLEGPHQVLRRATAVVVTRGLTDESVATAALSAITPPQGPAAPRLGGASLEPLPDESPLLAGSSGRACSIAGSGVDLIAPAGLLLQGGHEVTCAMGSETQNVAVVTKVLPVTYDGKIVAELRDLLPRSLAASHSQVSMRERYRITPLGTGVSFVLDLTPPLRLEVVLAPVCAGKRVLAIYLRSTNEETRAMLEEALSSLRPSSVGLSPACGDPTDG